MASWNEPNVTPELAKEHGITPDEWKKAVDAIGRTPSFTELGVISVMWSEHCSYKSSRVHLSRLPTKGPRVIQGPGENAGVVDIGDGWAVVFKMESHNHPSFIEPYQGAATGVGGILRDVFTMGARPVALMDSLRFGAPDHPKTRGLMTGVVAGIGGYGNSIGVPTVAGDVQFDPSYTGNILVNAFALGLAESDRIFLGRAEGVGNPILYVGAKTGRDGIHGATMASAEFDDQSEEKRPTVQVGDPFMEKLLLEACLEIFAANVLEGIQDMGAAGLTSSTVEMAGRAGNGVEIDLDMVPRRARNLTPYEILLSESQERMVMVARAGEEQTVIDICHKWDLDAVVIGRVTNTGRWVIKATPGFDPLSGNAPEGEKKTFVDLPVGLLTDDAPKYTRPTVENARAKVDAVDVKSLPFDAKSDLLDLLGSPNIGSRAWIYRQYDHIVRDGTMVRPGAGDAAVIRLFCENAKGRREKFIAVKSDCNGRFVHLDPKQGAAMAIAEACRNLVCVGAEPIGLTDCLNFGNPERPEIMSQFRDAIDGMRDACDALGVPIVSGNVSLYNETQGEAILPTPMIGAVGLFEKPNDVLTMGFLRPDDLIAVLGPEERGALGGSEWLTRKAGKLCGDPPTIDLAAEARLQKAVLAMARAKVLSSAHDCSEGGLAVAVAECCLANGLGAQLKLANDVGVLFGEDPSRVVVSFSAGQADGVRRIAAQHNVRICEIGRVKGATLAIDGVLEVSVGEMRERFTKALDAVVG